MKHHPRPTTPSVRPLAATCAALLAVLCALPRPASAQEPQFRNSGPPPLPTDTLRTLPRGAYTTGTETGIPSHTLFRDTGAPYTHALRNLELDPSVHSESVEGRFHLDLPSIRGDFPLLDRGFEPQDADLKIGPAFFKLRAFSLGLLVTDNKNLSENDRDADVIGIVRLTASVVIQLTEGFRIATTGSFVYLPFENKAGVAGFELVAPYTFGLAATPAFRTQIAWDTMIAGWPVTFADEVVLGVGRYSRSTRDDFELFEGGDFDEVDRAGRHVFRAPRRKHRDQDGRDIERDPDFNYLSNTVSASTERRLPADIQMNARIFREDLWYNQGRRGLPNLREGADLILREERENMRFKPYLTYRTLHTDNRSGFDQVIRLGVDGPITDQLHLDANAGYYYRAANGAQRFLWRLALHHTAGPYTRESLIAGSYLSDFHEELTQHVTYRINQVLGPKMLGQAFASYAHVEDLEEGVETRDEWRLGVNFSRVLGPKTRMQLGGTYADLNGGSFGHTTAWTGRFELSYHFTDTLLARLLYQFHERDRESDRRDRSYYENIVFLSVTKYFD